MREKSGLSAGEWKKLNCLRFWIWLDELFEIFILDESTKEWKIYAKKALFWLVFTVVFLSVCAYQNCWQKESKIKDQPPHGRWLKISLCDVFCITIPNFWLLQKTNTVC